MVILKRSLIFYPEQHGDSTYLPVYMYNCVIYIIMICVSCSVVSDSLQLHGLEPTRFLCPWDSPGKNTGVGCHALLQ